MDEREEEHHAILFSYNADRQCGKLIEQKENDILQKKDPFPKSVVNACRILAGGKNQDGTKSNRFTEPNYSVAFAINSRTNMATS